MSQELEHKVIFYPGQGMYKGFVVKERLSTIRCGFGKMTYLNGDSYEGMWENDKRNHYGVFQIGPTTGGGFKGFKGMWKNNIHMIDKGKEHGIVPGLNLQYMSGT